MTPGKDWIKSRTQFNRRWRGAQLVDSCSLDTVILTLLFNSLLLVVVVVSHMNCAFNQTVKSDYSYFSCTQKFVDLCDTCNVV